MTVFVKCFCINILLLSICINYALTAQINTTRMFVFGHSLLDHRPPAIPTPSDETTVPHWLYLLSQHEGLYYSATGQYGFLPQHANLPPIAQWGYDIVPPVWDSDLEPFEDADFTTIFITAANFIQWQGPDMDYPTDPGIMPLSATGDIIDWLMLQEDSLRIYIYENWPDMAPYLSNGFPPDSQDMADYNDYTLADFHDWWLEYHDSLLVNNPVANVRMIPVGPILSLLYQNTSLNLIPITELYEDDAPHGRATIYFLASLISYMAIHEKPAPLDYAVPSIIDTSVQNNYEMMVSIIWSELQGFNDSSGVSRVFFDQISNTTDINVASSSITLHPNPTSGLVQIDGLIGSYDIDILDSMGNVFEHLDSNLPMHIIDLSSLPAGMYFIRIQNNTEGTLRLEKILKLN